METIMKKMITLALAALAFAGSAKAQLKVPEPGLSFQAVAGLNISNINGPKAVVSDGVDVDKYSVNTKARAGFNVGLRAEYMLPKCYGVFVNAGIEYSMKGAKYDDVLEDYVVGTLPAADYVCEHRVNSYYVNIPVHVGYRYEINDDFGVFADFGPYFAIGTNGKVKNDYKDDIVPDTKTRLFSNSYSGIGKIHRWDCGVGFRVGAEYDHHHSLNMGFDFGLSDMYKDSFRRDVATAAAMAGQTVKLDKLKNFTFSLSYGYRF